MAEKLGFCDARSPIEFYSLDDRLRFGTWKALKASSDEGAMVNERS